MYANMNILTDEEAVELLKNNGKQKHEVKGGKIVLGEFKMFAGKKHTLPAKMIVVKRKQKPKKMFEKQQKEAKEFGMKLEPTNYKYLHKSPKKAYSRTPDNYPYEWFMGGVDSCQGDSGGPLWRNVKVLILFCLRRFLGALHRSCYLFLDPLSIVGTEIAPSGFFYAPPP